MNTQISTLTTHYAANGAVSILVVDDNPALLRSVERLLRMEGFRVLLAADGEEALRQLEAATPLPDLIISDIVMPRLDGFELFERVRERTDWLQIPFVFLTACDQADDLRHGYLLGVDDYLVKPLDQERLLLIVHSKLKRNAELSQLLRHQQNALDESKRTLALMVSHELRTPLVSITMVTDILARELAQMGLAQFQDMIEAMESGSSRLQHLVEQMVLFVQLQSGVLQETIEQRVYPNPIHEVLIGASERARQYCVRQRDVPIYLDERDPMACFSGDQGAVKHAVAELLLNAMSFSQGGKPVRVCEWVVDGMVWLSITDEGMGIPEAEIEKVFEPFYQVDRRIHEQQGVGIGLSLARGVIEAHGGVLELHSRLGQGTQVIVGLPALGYE